MARIAEAPRKMRVAAADAMMLLLLLLGVEPKGGCNCRCLGRCVVNYLWGFVGGILGNREWRRIIIIYFRTRQQHKVRWLIL